MRTERMQQTAEDPAITYMRRLDELVDQRNISYDQAMQILGDPPYDLYEETQTTDDAKQRLKVSDSRDGRIRRSTAYIGPQYGEEEGYLDGGERVGPEYYRPYTALSAEEVAERAEVARRGAALARRALHGE